VDGDRAEIAHIARQRLLQLTDMNLRIAVAEARFHIISSE